MITITKIFEFAAAHQLPHHKGLCKNIHGHTYILHVEVGGTIYSAGSSEGMIMDFGDLKRIVNEEIINKLDHSYLNDLFENPTAEMMVDWMSRVLKNKLELYRLRLYETPTSFAEWKVGF